MYKLKNISLQHVTLIKLDKDYNIVLVVVKPNEVVEFNSISEYLNLANLLDPYLKIFKVLQ
jgi:hypothetical protein